MYKYGKDERVIICDSLPSIEYWFLLHYLNTNRYFGTSKAVVKELLHYIPKFEKTERFLSTQKWVEDLCTDGKMQRNEIQIEAIPHIPFSLKMFDMLNINRQFV